MKRWTPVRIGYPVQLNADYKFISNEGFIKRGWKIQTAFLLISFFLKFSKSLDNIPVYNKVFNTFRSLTFLVAAIAV